MLPTPMGRSSTLIGICALSMLTSCQLIESRLRVPAPERALASEGADGPSSGGSSSNPGSEASEASDHDHDHEPDLFGLGSSSSPSDDEPTDETPGEGLPHGPPTLDPHAPQGVATASRYAGLDRSSCEAELAKRHVAFDRVGEARGVIAPLRLKGPLSGVTFRSNLSAKVRETAVIEIYDCRLVLALDDFARILAKHDIVEVIHLSVYRPVSSKITLKGAGRRHSGALAIDAAIFKTKDGKSFDVQKDFKGRIGAKPCPAPNDATELRKIACEANDARLFNVLLTPDYNWAHRNHFHLEVTAGVRWTLVR